MASRVRFVLLSVAAAFSAAVFSAAALAAATDETAPPAGRIDQLIRDLGSIEYVVRAAATEELTRIGLPAYSALETAARHPDREVRYRSRQVLNIIRHFDQERRLQEFLTGQGTAGPPLPGWTRFQKTYGDGGEQRRLFVEMQRADVGLLSALEDEPRAVTTLLAERMVANQQLRQSSPDQISLGQVAAAFFVAAEPDIRPDSTTLASLFSLCYQPAVRDVLGGDARRELPRKMLGAIITRCEGLDAFQAMNVARQFDMPEGLAAAHNILKAREMRMAPMVQYALITIAKLGDSSHLPLVETPELLADATAVTQFKEGETTYVIQLRDVALATAIVLSKQELKTYFGPSVGPTAGDPHHVFLNARVIGFATEDERSAVFAKWQRYKNSLK